MLKGVCGGRREGSGGDGGELGMEEGEVEGGKKRGDSWSGRRNASKDLREVEEISKKLS